MRKLNEQWVENGRMYKAVVQESKIVNRIIDGNICHGCCHVDNWDDDCLHPSKLCPLDKGLIVKDLGVLNEDGLLPCPFCGEYPKIIHPTENMPVVSIVHTGVGHRILLEFFSSEQEAIDAWNRRA